MCEIHEIVAALIDSGPDTQSVPELREALMRVRRVRAWLDHTEARIVSQLDSRPTVMPSVELARTGLRGSDARRVVARASTIETVPGFGSALDAGRVVSAHVDALGSGLAMMGTRADRLVALTPSLVTAAERLSPDDFAKHVRSTARALLDDGGVEILNRQRRRTCLKTWIDGDGMTVLHGRFDPERGTAITGLLQNAVDAMFHAGDRDNDRHHETTPDLDPDIEPNDHRRAVALLALLQGTRDSDRNSGPSSPGSTHTPVERQARAEIIVHIGLDALTGSLSSAGATSSPAFVRGGADLPIATIRRLACDAEIIPVVLNPHGVPLDVGRAQRLATVHQRRALEAMHPTCAAPGCSTHFGHCQPHHIIPWERGGPTDLSNLIPLCSRHHHPVHEGGWTVRRDPVTGLTAFEPPRE